MIQVLVAANKNGIRTGAPSAADHVRDAVHFKTLIVMNVAVENHELGVRCGRLRFQIMTQIERGRVGNAQHESGLQIRDQRHVKQEENKVRRRRKMRELRLQPGALRPTDVRKLLLSSVMR